MSYLHPLHTQIDRIFVCAIKPLSQRRIATMATLPLLIGLVPMHRTLAAEGVLEEVIVSAQRRAERIEDVPISVNAFNQKLLDDLNITNTDQLQFATPGIVNTSTAGDGISAVFIRGVGTGYSGPGLEGSVAVYLDDIYLQTQTSSAQSTLDVAQIQVLKGPQGTLYGRNATGGAVIVETNNPTLDNLEGYIGTGIGDRDWMRTEGAVNLPLRKTFALRLAGFYEERDGYIKNNAVSDYEASGVDSGSTYAARAKVLWQPSDEFSALATVSHDRRNGNGAVHSLRYNPDGSPTGLGFYRTQQSPNREGGGGDDSESTLSAVKISYDFPGWNISNTLAYREAKSYGCTDNDGVVDELLYFCLVSDSSPNPDGADGKEDQTLTNELRLSSTHDGAVQLTAGVFYEDNDARFSGRIGGAFFGTTTPTFDNRDKLEAFSAYVDTTWALSNAVKIIAGFRYTQEDKEHSVLLDDDAIALLGGTAPVYQEYETDFDNVSPRLVISYQTDTTNYYASFNQGFKSGGFNSPALTLDPPLDPEKIDAYELGAKYLSEDSRFSLSGAVFYYDWTDVQVAFITGGGAGILQQNAAGAENYGLETNLNWAPNEHWRLSAGFAYTHARYTDFAQAAVYNLVGGTLTASAANLKSEPVQHAPDYTGNVSTTYLFDLGTAWHGDVTLGLRYSSEYDYTAGAGGELGASQQDSLTLVNVTGSVAPNSDQYEIGWFVNNLLGEEYYSLISTGNTGVYASPAAPRTFGLEGKWYF